MRYKSPISNHQSPGAFPFKGNWLVNYDPKEFNYPDILITLAKISDNFNKNNIIFNSITINFNKNGIKNTYFNKNGDVILNFCGLDKEFSETGTKPTLMTVFKPLFKPIQTISLLFPRLESDPRWKSMGLPAGQLLLASNLTASGFDAVPLRLSLPCGNPPAEALGADMAGFTIFEDLLGALRPFLADFRGKTRGVIAAGGPFPTLSPLAAAYHLPQIDLLVRGEAEIALPAILEALNRGDEHAFFANPGVFWQQPGVIAMAGFDRVNRPREFDSLAINLDFLEAEDFARGMEMNFSRGCRRGCVFCCRVQGSEFRKLPLEKAEELLKEYSRKTDGSAGAARTVNINDDDILQDPVYAGAIFSLIKKHDFRIYGIQTSTASLVNGDGDPDHQVLALVSDPELYVEGQPLLWLGTDTFIQARARRLGKKLPPGEKFNVLMNELEKRGLRHFHYWISSDHDSTWEEFADELALICGFFHDFPGFGLLAHAPFVVPYPASSLFGRLPADDPRLKTKLALEAPDARFSYRVIDRLETKWPQLNNLLRNEKSGGEKGFFDFLKEKDLMAAAQMAYHFLKQESYQSSQNNPGLQKARKEFEELLGKLIENQDT